MIKFTFKSKEDHARTFGLKSPSGVSVSQFSGLWLVVLFVTRKAVTRPRIDEVSLVNCADVWFVTRVDKF